VRPGDEEAHDGLRELLAEERPSERARAREGCVSRSYAYNLLATFESEER
jgi:hypothetical protein